MLVFTGYHRYGGSEAGVLEQQGTLAHDDVLVSINGTCSVNALKHHRGGVAIAAASSGGAARSGSGTAPAYGSATYDGDVVMQTVSDTIKKAKGTIVLRFARLAQGLEGMLQACLLPEKGNKVCFNVLRTLCRRNALAAHVDHLQNVHLRALAWRYATK